MTYKNILVERRGKVGLITLNRPNALNALNSELVAELDQALDEYEADDDIRCIVITGNEGPSPPAPTSRRCQDKTSSGLCRRLRGEMGAGRQNPEAAHRGSGRLCPGRRDASLP